MVGVGVPLLEAAVGVAIGGVRPVVNAERRVACLAAVGRAGADGAILACGGHGL